MHLRFKIRYMHLDIVVGILRHHVGKLKKKNSMSNRKLIEMIQ